MRGKMLHRIYICGPMTPTGYGNHAIEYLTNVRSGIGAAISLMQKGFTVYCPMIDYQFWLSLNEGQRISYDIIRACSMSFVEHWAEGIRVLPGWEKSFGSREEIMTANKSGVPVFFEEADLVKYFEAEDLIYKH
jgi:hypothetical protein